MEELFTMTSLGLFLDVVGAVLIFFFGVPTGLNKDGSVGWEVEDSKEQRIKAAKYDCVARVGLVLLILGFILQLLGSIRS